MLYDVTIKFEFPAWDERQGIVYRDISARSKREAVKIVRRMGEDDGHCASGRGRYWLSATPSEE